MEAEAWHAYEDALWIRGTSVKVEVGVKAVLIINGTGVAWLEANKAKCLAWISGVVAGLSTQGWEIYMRKPGEWSGHYTKAEGSVEIRLFNLTA